VTPLDASAALALCAEAERIDREATPGPWSMRGCNHGNHMEFTDLSCSAIRAGDGTRVDSARVNATFIAAARTLLPALSTALRSALAQVEAWRPVVEAAGHQTAMIDLYMEEPAACNLYDQSTTATEDVYRAAYPAEAAAKKEQGR